ncbi:hypothetical protein F2P81_023967 [Scophthalmus maximus]|uniref:Osteoclast-stimulating factor 1 n=1 Tax=Scophthalmus maximus TaxID=52904 RepID=A0A6A4RSR4_SCOMX|nr:hypothetical protein F2P81_023967 [Scophthalmus maximus]
MRRMLTSLREINYSLLFNGCVFADEAKSGASVWAITLEEKGKHDKQFDSLAPVLGYVSGEQARKFFLQSGLPASVLAEIWNLADIDSDGKMDRLEFSIAMKLIKLKLQGRNLPSALPIIMTQPPVSNSVSTFPTSARFGMGSMPNLSVGLSSMSAMSTMPILTPLLANPPNPSLQPLVPTPMTLPLITSLGNSGLLNGNVSLLSPPLVPNNAVLPLSGFSSPMAFSPTTGMSKANSLLDLGSSRTLADVDKDGQLRADEFILAMHLVDMAKTGRPLPLTLPQDLVPPSLRGGIKSSELVNGTGPYITPCLIDTIEPEPAQKTKSGVSFEDKLKENFARGSAELEKRRLALEEAQRKERERRDREEREAQERREREAREQENRRRLEEERRLERQRQREEERLRELERKEAAKQEMERQRREEWERGKKEELGRMREGEQEEISQLRAKKRCLELELEAVGNKHKQISDRLRDAQSKKRIQKAEVDLINQKRDARVAEISTLQLQFEEWQRKLSVLVPEQQRLTEKLRNINLNKLSSASLTSVSTSVTEKGVNCRRLKDQLDTLERETTDKLTEMEQYNRELKELREKQTRQQAVLDDLHRVKEAKVRELQRRREEERERRRREEEEAARQAKLEEERRAQEQREQEKREREEEEARQRRLLEEQRARQREEEERAAQMSLRAAQEKAQEEERRRTEEEEKRKKEEEEEERKRREEEERKRKEEEEERGQQPALVDEQTVESQMGRQQMITLLPPNQTLHSVDAFDTYDSVQLEEYVALYTYESPEAGDLTFVEGDVVMVTEREGEWWRGCIGDQTGVFPSNYVRPVEPEVSKPGAVVKKPEIAQALTTTVTPTTHQLHLSPGQLIVVLAKNSTGWWLGELQARGKKRQRGWFHSSHVKLLGPTSNKLSPSPLPVCQVIAMYDYAAASRDELSFSKGQLINILDKTNPDWWKAEANGVTGLLPTNYVKMTTESDPSQQCTVDSSSMSEHGESDASATLFTHTYAITRSERSTTKGCFIFFSVILGSSIVSVRIAWALRVRKKTGGENMPVQLIGDVLASELAHMQPYIRFCSCQLNAAALLQSKTHNQPDFKDFLKILEHTPEGHADRGPLREALERAEELCSQVNEGVREKENSDRLEWIQSRVQSEGPIEHLVFNSLSNCLGPRKLLHSGRLYKTKSSRELWAFLFNDFLLLTHSAKPFSSSGPDKLFSPKFNIQLKIYKTPLFLNEVLVKTPADPSSDEPLFHVSHIDRVYALKTETLNERATWVQKIKAASEHFIETEKKKREKAYQARSLKTSGIGRLLVTVTEAQELKACKPNGKSNPYVELTMGAQCYTSRPVSDTLHPKWNFNCQFFIKDLYQDVLYFLGRTEVPVATIKKEMESKGNAVLELRLLFHALTKAACHLYLALLPLRRAATHFADCARYLVNHAHQTPTPHGYLHQGQPLGKKGTLHFLEGMCVVCETVPNLMGATLSLGAAFCHMMQGGFFILAATLRTIQVNLFSQMNGERERWDKERLRAKDCEKKLNSKVLEYISVFCQDPVSALRIKVDVPPVYR